VAVAIRVALAAGIVVARGVEFVAQAGTAVWVAAVVADAGRAVDTGGVGDETLG
jgi:hypothetical protein